MRVLSACRAFFDWLHVTSSPIRDPPCAGTAAAARSGGRCPAWPPLRHRRAVLMTAPPVSATDPVAARQQSCRAGPRSAYPAGMERRGDLWSPSPTALTVVCIAGFSISASTLIMLVPTLFQPAAQVHPLVLAGLVVLSAAFAAGARYWRPQAPRANLS